MRLASPRPGFCSVCFGAHPESRYVDCECAYDGAPVLDRETRTIAVIPWTGALGNHDDFYMCEKCARALCELLDMKPEVRTRQLQELRKLELERDHWRSTANRLRRELDAQLDSAFGPDRKRRAVAV